jgi:hypothetical protein
MGVIGSRGTGNITSSRRIPDVPKEIFYLQPDAAQLVQILFKAKKKVTINPKFTWYEKDLFPKRDQAGETKAAAGTTLTVDNGSYFKVGDVVKVEATGEVVLVTAVSTNVLTITRSFGSTAADTITDNDYLLVLGNACEEGSGSPSIKSQTSTEKYNYCQEFKTPFEVTDTLNNSDLYGGNDLQNESIIHMIEHKVDMERAFLFGECAIDETGTHPRRATGGVIERITTNVTDVSTTITESAFETFLESVFAYGSSTKLFLAAPKLISAINYWARGKLQTVPKDQTYGIAVKEYLSGHGTLLVAKHKLLTGSVYGGYGICLDMDKLWVRVMRNEDTRRAKNIQDNDETKRKDEYRTNAGIMLTNEEAHGVITGVTAYS